ncbi:MAG: UDP-N-acetylglucosamine 1-carboxyvinyltransferase, partial [Oscillospiraceae bacterium]
EGRMKGAVLTLPFPSVGATENIMLAAATAQGETVVYNAAREPEITDLAEFLNACGGHIHLSGDAVVIQGVERLTEGEHTVIPDRVETATLLCAGAVTGGELRLTNTRAEHLTAVLPVFEHMGCRLRVATDSIEMWAPQRLKSVSLIKTMPYPGFPTDAQAPVMAAMATAEGSSMFVENIFESRYKHVGELLRMGASINVEGRVAVVEGMAGLHSASVRCTDLRGGAALVIAALAADGVTELSEIRHIDRGYADFAQGLRRLGAIIQRVEEHENKLQNQRS